MTIKSRINNRIEDIWEKPLCNSKSERAPHLFGYCFIMCWRCSAIAVGILVTTVTKMMCSPLIAVVLISPTIIDGILQYKFNVMSTNKRRIVTGSVTGIGVGLVINYILNYRSYP